MEGCPYVFDRGPERIKDFRKARHTACVAAGVGKFGGEGKERRYVGKIFLGPTGLACAISSGPVGRRRRQ